MYGLTGKRNIHHACGRLDKYRKNELLGDRAGINIPELMPLKTQNDGSSWKAIRANKIHL